MWSQTQGLTVMFFTCQKTLMEKNHYKSQNSYQRNSGLSTVGDKQAQGGGGEFNLANFVETALSK